MDVSTLLEPTIDLKRLAEVLDGLGHEGRVHTTRGWGKKRQAELYEAAKGHMPLDLDFLVPPSMGALVEVIHDGKNTLPMFTHFQKRFVKLEGEDFTIGGYNHQTMAPVTGPGYFVVTKGEGEHEGELAIDYTNVPKHKPASWPDVRGNDGGLGSLVYGGMIDYLRGISKHVSIGRAYKARRWDAWFTLVRKGRRLTLSLRVLPRIAEIPQASWDALLRHGSSPFVEHTWLACLEEAKCVGESAGWIPQHFALYDGDELVAAAPAYAKTNSEGEFVFDWSWADLANRMGIAYYPKLVFAVPFTPATGDRVLVHPKRDRAETIAIFAQAARSVVKELEFSSAHVLFPREEEAKAWGDAGFSLRNGVQYHWSNRSASGGAPYESFEDFLTTLPTKKRTQIRRERKQPAMDGVAITTLRPEEYTRALAGEMYALYTTTVDKYFYGRRYMKKRMFELLAERWKERLAWVVARKDGEMVASAFNIEKDGIIYGRYWGTHVDLPFLHFNVCYYHGVDQAIREQCTTFNPGAGGEHKKVRGFDPTITWSAHHIENTRFRGIVESFLERERHGIRAYVASGGNDD